MNNPPAPVTRQESLRTFYYNNKGMLILSTIVTSVISIITGVAATTFCNVDGNCRATGPPPEPGAIVAQPEPGTTGAPPESEPDPRRAYLMSLITERSPSTDFSTASQALEWTWTDEYSEGWELLENNDDFDDRMVQRFGLASLFYITKGFKWIDGYRDGWLDSKKPACDWNMNDISCAAGFEVSALDLSGGNLFGSLPVEVGLLTELTSLDLSANQLESSIPFELHQLFELISLNLSDNQLTTLIWRELGLLTKLTSLNLYANQLEEYIPAELGLLTKLTLLDLYANKLTGYIPFELGLLTELTSLDLSANKLTGFIPAELGLLTKLEWLDLSNNQLTGTIPSSLCSPAVSFSFDCYRITCNCCWNCFF